jgi:hypothetical protein
MSTQMKAEVSEFKNCDVFIENQQKAISYR